MPTIDEKRVYTDESGTEAVYLATGLGVVSVSVSDDLIGEFGVVRRCHARDVATAGPYLAAATDDAVLLCDRSARAETQSTSAVSNEGLAFVRTGFGPATAVGFHDGAVLAGDSEGRIGRYEVTEDGEVGTASVVAESGTVGAVRAIDDGLIGAADGVYRVGGSGATHVGLDDARDVDGEPLVATASGLYKLGNGWMDVRSGSATAVDAAGDRGLAVCDGTLYARGSGAAGEHTDDEAADTEADGHSGDQRGAWTDAGLSLDGDIAAVTHGIEASYAVTDDGQLAVRLPGEAWRDRSLGVRDVAAAAV